MSSKFHESNTNIEVNLFIQEQCYCYAAKLSRSVIAGVRNCKSSLLWAAGKSMHYLEEWRQFLAISLFKFKITANYVGVFLVDEDCLSANTSSQYFERNGFSDKFLRSQWNL